MWNEGERAGRFVSWMVLGMLLCPVLVVGATLGLRAGIIALVVLLAIVGVWVAFGAVVNALLLGALALGAKAFRFFFPSKVC
jgi:hypothetical protein